MFLLVWSLDLATSAERAHGAWLACGIVLGAACIVRPTSLAIVAAFAIVPAVGKRLAAIEQGWRLSGALAAGALIVVDAGRDPELARVRRADDPGATAA